MPEPAIVIPPDIDSPEPEQHDSFAARATRLVEGKEDEAGNALDKEGQIIPKEPVAKKEPVEKAPKVEKEPDPKRPPDELFGGKKKEKEVETEPELETDKLAKPEFKDPKRAAQWDTLHEKARSFEKEASASKKQLAELQAKLTELETNGKASESLQAELAELKKQNAEQLKLVRQVDMTLDPAWSEKFVTGRSKLVRNAQTIVEESGGDPKAIETAMNLKGKPQADALAEIAEGMSSFQSGRLGRIVDELRSLDDEAAQTRTSPEQYLETRKREMKEQETQQRETYTRQASVAFDQAHRKMQAELEVLKPVDGLDWWNETGKQISSKARSAYETNEDLGTAAEIHIKAQAMDAYRDFYLKEREHSASLEKTNAEQATELKKLYGTGPKLGGGGGGGNEKSVKDMSMAERVDYEMSRG